MNVVFQEIYDFLASDKKHSLFPAKGTTTKKNPINNRFNTLFGKYATSEFVTNKDLSREQVFNLAWDEVMSSCKGCILHAHRNNVVRPDGHFEAPIMIILEGPGFLEDLSKTPICSAIQIKNSHCGKCMNVTGCYGSRLIRIGEQWPKSRKKSIVCEPKYTDTNTFPSNHFVRSTGTILDGILYKEHGFKYPRYSWETNTKYSPWFITNSVLCRSWNPSRLEDETPPAVAIQSCFPWFLLTYFCLKPKVIVCLGEVGLKTVTGYSEKNLKKLVSLNTPFQSPFGTTIYNSHPARMMRSPDPQVKASLYSRLGATLRLALEEAGLEDKINRILI